LPCFVGIRSDESLFQSSRAPRRARCGAAGVSAAR